MCYNHISKTQWGYQLDREESKREKAETEKIKKIKKYFKDLDRRGGEISGFGETDQMESAKGKKDKEKIVHLPALQPSKEKKDI